MEYNKKTIQKVKKDELACICFFILRYKIHYHQKILKFASKTESEGVEGAYQLSYRIYWELRSYYKPKKHNHLPIYNGRAAGFG